MLECLHVLYHVIVLCGFHALAMPCGVDPVPRREAEQDLSHGERLRGDSWNRSRTALMLREVLPGMNCAADLDRLRARLLAHSGLLAGRLLSCCESVILLCQTAHSSHSVSAGAIARASDCAQFDCRENYSLQGMKRLPPDIMSRTTKFTADHAAGEFS